MEKVTPLQNQDIGFYRVPQITELLCISKSTWWLWVQNGKAPRGRKITSGVTAWPRAQIHQFMRELESQGDDEPTPPSKGIAA